MSIILIFNLFFDLIALIYRVPQNPLNASVCVVKAFLRFFYQINFFFEKWRHNVKIVFLVVSGGLYINRVRLNNQLTKILQVIIPFIFYPFYIRYPHQPWLTFKQSKSPKFILISYINPLYIVIIIQFIINHIAVK